MKRNKEIKAAARQALNGHWGWAILVCIIFGAISGVLALPSAISSLTSTAARGSGLFNPAVAMATIGTSLITSFATFAFSLFAGGPLTAGVENAFNKFYSNSDYNTVGNMFRLGFGEGRYWKNVWGMFLMGLFTALWTLLFIVPGIIKSFAYALTPYILIDNPELGPNEARLKSIELMRGYKGKLFGLWLSFIGWFLLCILSLGIGFIWLTPYIKTSFAAFYRDRIESEKAQIVTQ